MASPSRGAKDKTVILGKRFSIGRGIVSVTTSSLMGDSSILCTAGPESTGWVQQA